jgi:predicted RNA-binding protein associated with RNAse of E/G family
VKIEEEAFNIIENNEAITKDKKEEAFDIIENIEAVTEEEVKIQKKLSILLKISKQ